MRARWGQEKLEIMDAEAGKPVETLDDFDLGLLIGNLERERGW